MGHIPSPCSTNRPQPAVCSFPFPFLPSLLLSRRWRSLSLSRSLARSIAVLLAVSLFVLVATLVLDVCMHVFCCDLCFGSECSGVSEFWCFLVEAAVRRVLRSNWFGSGVRFSVFFCFVFFFFCKTRTGDSKEPLDSLLPLLFRSIERLVCLFVGCQYKGLVSCCRRLCDEIC